MVDIHSHVLWGLDDGSDSRATSLAMLKIAAEAGTSDIVATPHANSEYTFQPEVIEARLLDLQSVAEGERPKLHRGCDFHLSYENIEDALKHPRKYTIDGGNFLLVEFADLHVPQSVANIFDRLMDRGMFPIITHPERNPILSRKLDQLTALVERGSFVQVTAKSLEGGFGNGARAAGWTMLSRGMVHFVASDGHDPEYRPPRLDAAFKLVAAKMGKDAAGLLFTGNPAEVIGGGGPSSIGRTEPAGKRSFFSTLWKR
jgi:protein-tyrosine phosphatase